MAVIRDVVVKITADTTQLVKALQWCAYIVTRHDRQPSDPCPFPHIRLFRWLP